MFGLQNGMGDDFGFKKTKHHQHVSITIPWDGQSFRYFCFINAYIDSKRRLSIFIGKNLDNKLFSR